VAKSAGKPARSTSDRVQGIESIIEDLTLRASGRSLELELGLGLIPTPKLIRTTGCTSATPGE
jgi:hypothetical protein